MDLYGDLPPTADGSSDSNTVVIGEGWAKPGATLVPKSAVQTSKTPASEKKSIKMNFVPPAPVRKPAPSTAAFKPRQTAKPVVAANAASTNARATSSGGSFSLLAPVVTEEVVVRKKLGDVNESGDINSIPPCSLSHSTSAQSDDVDITSSPAAQVNPAVATYECNDPYDPSKPNDYIQWCEERLERRRLRRLEEENRRTLQAQEESRAAKEKERAEAMEQRDYAKLQATLPAMGRGRGRGMSNLPAWMTSAEGGLGSALRSEAKEAESSFKEREVGKFDDDPRDNSIPPGKGNDSAKNEGGGGGDRDRIGSSNIDIGIGSRIMANMGYEGAGRGLGRSGQGIVNPIQVRSAGGQGVMEVDEEDKRRFLHGGGGDSSGRMREGDDRSDRERGGEDMGGGESVNKRRRGLFSTPSCVVLLKNMVGAGEVDEGLAEETKAECHKYGEVKSCVIREVSADMFSSRVPEEERVRMFVCFERQDGAVRAFRDLNGRFFGGRQIAAVFYDEDKFAKGDLDPSPGEW